MKTNVSHNKANTLYSVILLLILTLTAFSGCKGKDKKAQDKAKETPVFAVNTTLAVKGQIQDYLTFSGDIVAGSTIDVYPKRQEK